jgi:hypothetical protein
VTRDKQQAQWAKFYAQLPADQKRVTDDIVTRAPDNSGQQMQWAAELVALVDLLLRRDPGAPPWPVVRMFWVRLHGVVTEMAEIHSNGSASPRSRPPLQRVLSTSRPCPRHPLCATYTPQAFVDAGEAGHRRDRGGLLA